MTRVLIVDDEPIFRKGLLACVKWSEHDCEVVGQAQNGREAVAMIDSLRPDVVLLDIKMPMMDGIEVLRVVAPRMPDVHFIMLSCMNEFELVRAAMKHGARDYLFKPVICETDILESIAELRNRTAIRAKEEQPTNGAETNAETVSRVCAWIHAHYAEPLTLDSLSLHACLSKNYFCRIFRSETGETPMGYLTRVRIAEADRLFAETTLSISAVCERVGYHDYAHFCKTYKRLTNRTPGQRRRDQSSSP